MLAPNFAGGTPLTQFIILAMRRREVAMILDIFLNIILGIILVGGVYFGYRQGFLRIAYTPVKFFAAIALTFFCCVPIGNALIKPIVQEPISNYAADYLYEHCGEATAENIEGELPTLLKIAASIADINIDDVAAEAENEGKAVIDAVADRLTEPLARLVAVVIAFVILYFISKIIIGLLLRLLNHLLKGGVLGWVNKILGVLFGSICGIILAWGTVAILEFAFHSSVFEGNSYVSEFEGHALYYFFKTYSPLELLLSF